MESPQPPEDSAPPVNEVNPAPFRFALRKGEPDDLRFVGESWRRHYSDSNWARCPGGKDEYIATQKQVIATALATSEVLVAYPAEPRNEPQQILGWVCYRRPSVVHYVFVKPYYRQQGIGRALLITALPALADLKTKVYVTHGWRPPHGKGDGINAVMDRAQRLGIRLELNPALIFGGHT